MDALDGSQEMLDEAMKKNAYKNFICDFMGTNRLDIEDSKLAHRKVHDVETLPAFVSEFI